MWAFLGRVLRFLVIWGTGVSLSSGLQKSIQRYETIIYSPKYMTVNSTHPYETIDIDNLVCKNTRQCHQEITNLMGSEMSSCLRAIEKR